MNYVYINLANISIPDIPGTLSSSWGYWNATPDTYKDFPLYMYATASPDVPNAFVYPGYTMVELVPGLPPFKVPLGSPGLAYDLISTNKTTLKRLFGIDEKFTFILAPTMLFDNASIALQNLVEDSRSQIVIAPLTGTKEMYECDGLLPADGSLTPDCLDPQYNRMRRGGSRRFETLFSVLCDSTANQLASLDAFRQLGIRSLVVLRDASVERTTFSKHAALATVAAANQLNIAVLDAITMIDGSCLNTGAARAATCPPSNLKEQQQIFDHNMTAMQMAEHIVALNPDALVFLGTPGTSAGWSFGQLFYGFRTLGYTPRMVSFGGGMDGAMAEWLPGKELDMQYTWNSKPWDPKLKGPSYQNYPSDTSFELLPAERATATTPAVDGPAVFSRVFDATYGPNRPGGAHPWYELSLTDNSSPAIGWASLQMIQKMIEVSESSDVDQILEAARSMAYSSMYGELSFDRLGRTTRVNEVLQQQTPNGLQIISPYNIGVNPVFPLPTWTERTFNPQFYSTLNERVMIAVNSVCILACIGLIIAVGLNHKSPVIRAATPSFCIVTLVGAIAMLTSNYFETLVVNDAHCSAQVWLLSIGFTLTYSSCFIKTFRIWRIFGGQKLQVLKMRDADLLMAVGVFVLVDIILNAAWAASVGMHAVRITVDPIRPAYDYKTCSYPPGALAVVYLHLAIKGGMLLFGAGLTFLVRNVPSQFNESSLLGLSIYNTSFAVVFVVPILAVHLGGRETVYLIRGFAIMFISITTVCLLYVPKLLLLRTKLSVAKFVAGTRAADNRSNRSDLPTATNTKGGATMMVRQDHSSAGRSAAGRHDDDTVDGSMLSGFNANSQAPTEAPVSRAPTHHAHTASKGGFGRGTHPPRDHDREPQTPASPASRKSAMRNGAVSPGGVTIDPARRSIPLFLSTGVTGGERDRSGSSPLPPSDRPVSRSPSPAGGEFAVMSPTVGSPSDVDGAAAHYVVGQEGEASPDPNAVMEITNK